MLEGTSWKRALLLERRAQWDARPAHRPCRSAADARREMAALAMDPRPGLAGLEDHIPSSVRPGCSAGRGPAGHRNLSLSAAIGTSLMLASRRRMSPFASNSHCSLP